MTGLEFFKIAFEAAAVLEKLVECAGNFWARMLVLVQRRLRGYVLIKQIGVNLFLKVGHVKSL